MFNILSFLEKKRIKYNYQSIGPYKKYLVNLTKFEKMSHLKNYFTIEILLLNLKNIKKRREGIKFCRKIEKLIEGSVDSISYKKYLTGILAYYRGEYEKALNIFNGLFDEFFQYDSFIYDMNILIDLIEKELKIENRREIITHTIYGLKLNFNSEMELKFFQANKQIGDSLTFNKKLIAAVLDIKIEYEKLIGVIANISMNKQIKILVSRKFYIDILMKQLKNLNDFLDENFYEKGQFVDFCETLNNSREFIELLYKFNQCEFSVRDKIMTYDLSQVNSELRDGFTFLRENLESVENISRGFLIKTLKEKFKKDNFIRKKDDTMPFLPIFYDLAYDYIDDMADESMPNVKDLSIN